VAGAAVSAVVSGDDGSSTTVALADAGGGRYTGATGALPAGYHMVVATADSAAGARTTSTSATAGGDGDNVTPSPPSGGTQPGGTQPGGTPPSDGGGTPPGSTPTTAKPALKLTAGGRKRQSLRRGVLAVTCRATAAGRCSAGATVKSAGKRLRSRTVAHAVKAGHPVTLKLAFGKPALARLRRALAHHKALKATVALTLRDATGRTAHAALTIRLAR
jgi:hypothetical protein